MRWSIFTIAWMIAPIYAPHSRCQGVSSNGANRPTQRPRVRNVWPCYWLCNRKAKTRRVISQVWARARLSPGYQTSASVLSLIVDSSCNRFRSSLGGGAHLPRAAAVSVGRAHRRASSVSRRSRRCARCFRPCVCRLPRRGGGVSVYTPPRPDVPSLPPCVAAGRGSGCGRRHGCFHPAVPLLSPPRRCAAGPRLRRHAAVAVCLCACARRLPWGWQGCGARAPPRL